MFHIGRRGQEAVAFELLVSVIIMTFVLIMGINALNEINDQKCAQEIKKELQDFKFGIEQAAKPSGKANIDFYMPGCFNDRDDKVTLYESTEPTICAYYCVGTQQVCTLLQFTTSRSGVDNSTECVSISTFTDFLVDASYCGDFSPDKYERVDLKVPEGGSIPEGRYILVNKSNITQGTPVICAYRQTG